MTGLKAPGFFQYRNPGASWLGPPPHAKIKQRRIRPESVRTLKVPIQNSISPKTFTPERFMQTMTTRKTAMKTPGLTVVRGTQYCKTSADAVNWLGTEIKYLNQYLAYIRLLFNLAGFETLTCSLMQIQKLDRQIALRILQILKSVESRSPFHQVRKGQDKPQSRQLNRRSE
jgi:hypothetical protein